MKSVDSLLNRRRMRIAFQCILAAFILLPARSLPLETVQEVEARWVEMKKNFGYRPKTLELIANIARRQTDLVSQEKELEEFLHESSGSYSIGNVKSHLHRMQELGTSDRVRFMIEYPDHFRYEHLQQIWEISSELSPRFRNILTVQSRHEYWRTDEINRNALVDRSGRRLNLRVQSADYPLYSTLNRFLELPPVVQSAEFTRLLAIGDYGKDAIVYTISHAPAGTSPDSQVLMIGYDPSQPASDISFMAFLDNTNPTRSVGLVYEYHDWQEVGSGIRRPFYMADRDFDIDWIAPDEFAVAWRSLPSHDITFADVKTFKFDLEISPSEFEFSPPRHYTVREMAEDGALTLIYSPQEIDNQRRFEEIVERRAAEAQERRLQRIDARVGGATFWGRAGIYMGVFGGICLILAAFYYMRRIKG